MEQENLVDFDENSDSIAYDLPSEGEIADDDDGQQNEPAVFGDDKNGQQNEPTVSSIVVKPDRAFRRKSIVWGLRKYTHNSKIYSFRDEVFDKGSYTGKFIMECMSAPRKVEYYVSRYWIQEISYFGYKENYMESKFLIPRFFRRFLIRCDPKDVTFNIVRFCFVYSLLKKRRAFLEMEKYLTVRYLPSTYPIIAEENNCLFNGVFPSRFYVHYEFDMVEDEETFWKYFYNFI